MTYAHEKQRWITKCGLEYVMKGNAAYHERACWSCMFGNDDPSKLTVDINRKDGK